MYTGTIKVDQTDGLYFFWFFYNPKDIDKNLPLSLWLNGGPGSPSMTGLFLENGPLKVSKLKDGNFKVDFIEYSWLSASHMVYVDQPIDVGFSMGSSNITSEALVGQYMLNFFLEFY